MSLNPEALKQVFTAGNFRPPFIEGLVRKCEIWRDDRSKIAVDSIEFYFDLWDADCGWPGIQKGDRLIFDDLSSTRVNKRIIGSENGSVTVEWQDGGAAGREFGVGRQNSHVAHIVKELTPSDYYIAMLGIYIGQIFFVNLAEGHGHIPQAIYYYEQGRSIGASKLSGISPLANRPGRLWPPRPKLSIDELFQSLAVLYVRLLTREVKTIGEVRTCMQDLRRSVAETLQCEVDDLLDSDVEVLIGKCETKAVQSKARLTVDQFPELDGLATRVVLAS